MVHLWKYFNNLNMHMYRQIYLKNEKIMFYYIYSEFTLIYIWNIKSQPIYVNLIIF